ncbi:hypothetical protein BJV77DRAFT_199900 [Russula vinacea]|nr:hypothetical protein BJV77DRAFT_199900 [Russula vinacea]
MLPVARLRTHRSSIHLNRPIEASARMVNFHDPATIAQDYVGVLKLWHFVDGLFIWEFVTTLDYEWEVIRGKRPYRWTYGFVVFFGLITAQPHSRRLGSAVDILLCAHLHSFGSNSQHDRL